MQTSIIEPIQDVKLEQIDQDVSEMNDAGYAEGCGAFDFQKMFKYVEFMTLS